MRQTKEASRAAMLDCTPMGQRLPLPTELPKSAPAIIHVLDEHVLSLRADAQAVIEDSENQRERMAAQMRVTVLSEMLGLIRAVDSTERRKKRHGLQD